MAASRPEDRSTIGKLAGHASWAGETNPTARTAPARAKSPGSLDYWERRIDPDGTLDPADRARRADHARKSHFYRLALKSAQARRARAGGASDAA